MTTDWGAYFRSLRKPEPVTTETAYPAPERTSRDPWPEDFTEPGPVTSLRGLAGRFGWSTAVTYSRAHTPRSDNGKPGALAHHVVVRMFHPESRARCIAHHATPVTGKGAKWLSVLIVSPVIPPYAGCSITDAKDFVTHGGVANPEWLDGIKRRNRVAAIRDKVWADHHKGVTLGDMAVKYETDKIEIMRIIKECRDADRAVPGRTTRKREAS